MLITESGKGFLLCAGGGGGGKAGLLRESGWLDAIAPGGIWRLHLSTRRRCSAS